MSSSVARGHPFHAVLGVVAMALLSVAVGCSKESPAASGPTASSGTAAPAPTTAAGPTTTAWAGAPNPCSLLTDEEIRAVTHFEVTTERVDSKAPDGALLPNCRSVNRTSGTKGGYFTVTVIPPGSPMLADHSTLTDTQEIAGIGKSATMGHHARALGAGTNVALVDMGNGGFLIGALVFTDVTAEDMRGLVTEAAGRWKPT